VNVSTPAIFRDVAYRAISLVAYYRHLTSGFSIRASSILEKLGVKLMRKIALSLFTLTGYFTLANRGIG
jgi:hypothetical protein